MIDDDKHAARTTLTVHDVLTPASDTPLAVERPERRANGPQRHPVRGACTIGMSASADLAEYHAGMKRTDHAIDSRYQLRDA